MEYAPHGCLLNFLRSKREIYKPVWAKKQNKTEEEFTLVDQVMMSYHVACGMEYLASQKVYADPHCQFVFELFSISFFLIKYSLFLQRNFTYKGSCGYGNYDACHIPRYPTRKHCITAICYLLSYYITLNYIRLNKIILFITLYYIRLNQIIYILDYISLHQITSDYIRLDYIRLHQITSDYITLDYIGLHLILLDYITFLNIM